MGESSRYMSGTSLPLPPPLPYPPHAPLCPAHANPPLLPAPARNTQRTPIYIQKIDNNELDVSELGGAPFALAWARGVSMNLVYIKNSISNAEALIVQRSLVTKPRDLLGQRVGTIPSSTAHFHMLYVYGPLHEVNGAWWVQTRGRVISPQVVSLALEYVCRPPSEYLVLSSLPSPPPSLTRAVSRSLDLPLPLNIHLYSPPMITLSLSLGVLSLPPKPLHLPHSLTPSPLPSSPLLPPSPSLAPVTSSSSSTYSTTCATTPSPTTSPSSAP